MEHLGGFEAIALLTAMAFRTRSEQKRRQDDPEYKAKAEELEQEKAEKHYAALYNAAHIENEEYSRAPRAFLRRLRKECHAE